MGRVSSTNSWVVSIECITETSRVEGAGNMWVGVWLPIEKQPEWRRLRKKLMWSLTCPEIYRVTWSWGGHFLEKKILIQTLVWLSNTRIHARRKSGGEWYFFYLNVIHYSVGPIHWAQQTKPTWIIIHILCLPTIEHSERRVTKEQGCKIINISHVFAYFLNVL